MEEQTIVRLKKSIRSVSDWEKLKVRSYLDLLIDIENWLKGCRFGFILFPSRNQSELFRAKFCSLRSFSQFLSLQNYLLSLCQWLFYGGQYPNRSWKRVIFREEWKGCFSVTQERWLPIWLYMWGHALCIIHQASIES